MRLLPFVALLLPVALAACGVTQVSMPYEPTVALRPADPPQALISVPDRAVNERQAGRDDPTWIGTIRGGYGNPLKALNADGPVDRVVAKAFEAGLAARGLLGPQLLNPRYRLAITIHQFDANQYIRREATADFSIALIESATGREVWRDRHRAYAVDGSILALNVGIFAAPEDLRRVALRTMNETVDVLLDNPGFRAVLAK